MCARRKSQAWIEDQNEDDDSDTSSISDNHEKHRSLASDGWVWNICMVERNDRTNRRRQFCEREIPQSQAKQLHMVGYLCELVYNLALAPGENVSQSPGFETPLGVFGGVAK
jgi:hypothetical protein